MQILKQDTIFLLKNTHLKKDIILLLRKVWIAILDENSEKLIFYVFSW